METGVLGLTSETVLGLSVERLALAALALAAGVGLRHVLCSWFCAWLAAWAARTRNALDDRVIAAIRTPLPFLPVALSLFVAAEILALEGGAEALALTAARSLLALTAFWIAARLVDPLSMVVRSFESLSPEVANWALRAARIAIWAVAAATILELWGIRVAPILAGFGLLGVAVALGAQDLFKNLISGMLILTERRFRVGDWVKIDGVVEGVVESIGFRSTKVRRFDKAPVYIPNARFADDAVTNFGEMTHRRISWRIGLEYGATAAQLREVRERIETFILEDERFLKPPEATLLVRLDGFEASSIDLMIYCFTRTRDWSEWLSIKEELLIEVKRVVEGAGTAFAFPSRTVYVEPASAAAVGSGVAEGGTAPAGSAFGLRQVD